MQCLAFSVGIEPGYGKVGQIKIVCATQSSIFILGLLKLGENIYLFSRDYDKQE